MFTTSGIESNSTVHAQRFLPLMQALANASAAWIMPYFQSGTAVEMKPDATPVTEADRGAERVMREMILTAYPEHGVTGEEYGSVHADAEYRWVLDPIDGTKSFVAGVPLFGTLIALCHYGVPVLGCINLPALGMRVLGDGTRCTLNGRAVRARNIGSVDRATLLVTDPADIARRKSAAAFHRLSQRVALYRSWGDCYGYALLATGAADIMIDASLQSWDMMALLPILAGAGLAAVNYEGGGALGSDSLVAAHPALLDTVISLLNEKH